MSCAIHLSDPAQLRDFFRWITQPQLAYAWREDDRIYVCPPARKGRRGTRGFQAWVWLPDAAIDDEALAKVCVLLGVKGISSLPDEARSGTPLTLAQFLHRCQLVKPVRSSRVSNDLVVALFGADPQSLTDAYASTPKNPAFPSTITFLEKHDAHPDCIIHLPQADLGFHWDVWLDSENRRLAPKGGCARLFWKASEGDAAYFVEHGWRHPIPNLADLYPNPHHAQWILIGAAEPAASVARWYEIVPHAGDVSMRPGDGEEGVKLDVDLAGRVESLVSRETAQGPPLCVKAAVQPLFPARGDRLELIGRRIQGVKNSLAELEQQRAALLDRGRGGFRLLLRFAQKAAGEGTPQLSPDFQKFLVLSRRSLDRFEYLYQQQDDGCGYHVVATRDPVFYQDIHRGLAEESYYQMQVWPQWDLDIFVADDCYLVPRIDSPEMAAALMKSLFQELGGREGRDYRLLISADPHKPDALRVRALPRAEFRPLPQQLDFLNTDYPVEELRARHAARDHLVNEATKLNVDLDTQVERIEQEFKKRATERLECAQRLWNPLAVRLEQAATHLGLCQDRFDVFEEMLRDFAVTWREFVDGMLDLNRSLIEAKLKALEHLARDEAEWRTKLDAIEQGNRNMAEEIPPLRTAIEARRAEVAATSARVRLLYEEVAEELRNAQADLDRVCAEAQAMVDEAADLLKKARRTEAEYRARLAKLTLLNRELTACRNRLKQHVAGFDARLAEATALHTELARLAAQLAERTADLAHKRENCTTQQKGVATTLTALRAEHAAAAEEIEQATHTLDEGRDEADTLRASLERRIAALRQQRVEANRACEACTQRKIELEAEQRALERAQQRLAAAREELAREETKHAQCADQMLAAADDLQTLAGERIETLADRLREAAEQLHVLASLERSTKPLDWFRQSVRSWARAAAVHAEVELPSLAEVDPEGRLMRLFQLEPDTASEEESHAVPS